MRLWHAIFTSLVILAASSALAFDRPPAPTTPPGGGGIGVPGPIAGAGLPLLALVGGYFLVRRWRKQ